MRLTLHPHPAVPPLAAAVSVRLAADAGGGLRLDYRITAAAGALTLPPRASGPGTRTDGLWRTTCVELFLAAGPGGAYREFNFSPSGDWAVYDFTALRQRGPDPSVATPPAIEVETTPEGVVVRVRLAPDLLPTPGGRAALCAVLAAPDGRLAYWALAHPQSVPDFHHPGGFTAAAGPAELAESP